MNTIGIIGTKRKNSTEHFIKVEEILKEIISDQDRICSGLCSRSADRFAVRLAEKYGNRCPLWFPAEWKKYGRIAGFKRNTDIAINSDILIALVADDRTGGTEDTIKKFIKFHGKENLIIVT